jgi:prolyl oligopeptidase PreP (S9A serine peptidase family)
MVARDPGRLIVLELGKGTIQLFGRKRGVDLLDTEEMGDFLGSLDHLNQAQLMALRAGWRATSQEDHEVAWGAVRAVADARGLSKEIGRVRDTAMAWTTRSRNAVPFYQGGNDEMVWQQIKIEAGEAIVDAALAIALGDRLDDATHDVLIGPWLAATESEG